MKKITPLFVNFALLLTSCATNQAAQLREKKPISVGLLGAQYRPMANVGLGIGTLGGDRDVCEGAVFCSLEQVAKGIRFKDDEFVRARGRTTEVTVYANYFPWDTSAFFVGGGLGQRWVNVDMTLRSSKEEASYKSSVFYLRPATGWNWIWEPGFSFFLDVGLGIPMSQKRTLSSGASQNAKDAAKYLDENFFQDYRSPMIGGSFLIGWSFGF